MANEHILSLVRHFCFREDLSTDDPYDVWKTKLGFKVKNLFNCNRILGIGPAAILTVVDSYINNRTRFFYRQQEYPIVRAWAVQILLSAHQIDPKDVYLDYAVKHLNWLSKNSAPGYKGMGWGIGFELPISCDLVYAANTPFATITPYVLEAFVKFHQSTGRQDFNSHLRDIKTFFDEDIQILRQSENQLATSYGPQRDRIVINAVAYAMYAYSLLLKARIWDDHDRIREKILQLYQFIVANQNRDGSWFYSPDGKSFIDCFHSAIVIKNIVKTNQTLTLPGASEVVTRSYRYLKENLFDSQEFLFKRFAVKNKPSIVKFDLYDNAEALNLAILLNDNAFAKRLSSSIAKTFCRGKVVYSQIGLLGIKQNREMLRWAIMPYLFALTKAVQTNIIAD